MSIKQRQILFGVFVLAFLVITPLIIIYAAGYKIDNKNWRLEKTGMLIAESEPENANIYINDKVQTTFFKKTLSGKSGSVVTPAKIKNLLPGNYDIKIELDGYWPWQKKLTIEPGKTTYAEDIYLFKKNLPILILNNGIIDLKISPNKKYLSAATVDQLTIINLATETKTTKSIKNLSSDKILWSSKSNKILVNDSVLDIPKLDEEATIDALTDSDTTNIKWEEEKLLYLQHNSIYSYNSITNKSQEIFSAEKIIDFKIKGEQLYALTESNSKNYLEIYKLNDKQLLRTIILPYRSRYSLDDFQNNLITLRDENHDIIYLIDPTSTRISPVEEIINQVKQSQWVDGNKLLYANDFEIWLYDTDSRRQNLITRISDKINFIAWHPSNNYVIYTTDKAIYAIELDKRDKMEINELLKIDNISMPQLNQTSKIIYFNAKIGKQEGLYKLYIH